MVDQAQYIQAGEELNIQKLKSFLSDQLHSKEQLEVMQLPTGSSHLTYLLHLGHYELVLRRPSFGANETTWKEIEREFAILKALKPVYAKVPNPVLYCNDTFIMGVPFYIMARVRGIILRKGSPKEITLYPSTMHNLSEKLVDNLVTIHAIDVNLAEIAQLGKGEGYIQRQLEECINKYENFQTDTSKEIDEIIQWLKANQPVQQYISIIHNDYKYDNIVFDSDLSQILAVLDWETATIGDPLMDLGTTLGYWIEPSDPKPLHTLGLTTLPGNLNRQQLVERYAHRSGRDIKHAVFYYVFGLFKISLIVQQLNSHYQWGASKNERFASVIPILNAYIQMARRSIDHNRINKLS